MTSKLTPTRLRLLLTLGLVIGLSAAAQNSAFVKRGTVERQGRAWVEEARCGADVTPGQRLLLRTELGSVEVVPGANNRLQCRILLRAYTRSESEARDVLSRFGISIRRGGDGVSVVARLRKPVRAPLAVKFEIEVPERFNVDLETQGGELVVDRLRGSLQAVTAGGDIRTGDIDGPVRVETAGGGIQVGNIGGRLQARTAGGSIHTGDINGDAQLETSGGEISAGRVTGTIRSETAGGDIMLLSAGSDIFAQTAGGQIRIGDSGGAVQAQTAGGSVVLEGARGPIRVHTAGGSINLYHVGGAVQASTAAGKILAQIAAKPESFGASELQSSFGDVEVYLPPDLPLTIDAAIQMATGQEIRSDFPLTIKGGNTSYAPTTVTCNGSLNGGGKVLRIRTTAGNILIRKLDAAALERLQERQKSLWKRLEELRNKIYNSPPKPDDEP